MRARLTANSHPETPDAPLANRDGPANIANNSSIEIDSDSEEEDPEIDLEDEQEDPEEDPKEDPEEDPEEEIMEELAQEDSDEDGMDHIYFADYFELGPPDSPNDNCTALPTDD
ncbi:hypothetical protein PIB30_079667 [Stylosanthes scabra]|uniref:Uncharacterized protein n=1 Tax=Stylosanthes scabra TaxID=79078 RepID=A0ABU6VRJ0_9FABA|nr:hypothetical protein [Stylosanthes scabra]